jgi:hypothetical protein
MASDSATYIPLKQAAKKYHISEETLNQVQSGSITAARLPDGELLVAEQEIDPSLNITREQFSHLRDSPIGLAEAGRKYGVSQPTVTNWVKAGYRQVLRQPQSRDQKKLIDEADVAFCAAVYNAKRKLYGGQLAGVPIFDEEGNPYQVKYPDIAAERRTERRQKREDS